MVYKETLSRNYGDRVGIERVVLDAVATGKGRYLSRLLASGFNVNVADGWRQTPLIKAAFMPDPRNRLNMVKLLLEHGANAELQDKDAMSPLMYATVFGHNNIVPILIEQSAENLDLRHTNKQGIPLLSLAVISENIDTVRMIAEAHSKLGVHVDDVWDFDCITPFMEAKRRGFREIAKYLQEEHKASPLRVDKWGNSAQELEIEFDNMRREEMKRYQSEWNKINPPRFSLLHPQKSQKPPPPQIARPAQSAVSTVSRASRVSQEPSEEDLMEGLFRGRNRKPRANFKLGKVDVTRSDHYCGEFSSSLQKYQDDLKYGQREVQSAYDTSDVTATLRDLLELKRDRDSDLYLPCFENERVELEPEQRETLEKARRREKRRGKKVAELNRHVGYNFTISDEIRKNLTVQKEVSFAIRRPSMASRKSMETVEA